MILHNVRVQPFNVIGMNGNISLQSDNGSTRYF